MPKDIERFRDSLLEGDTPLSPVTVNKVLTTLAAIFQLAMRDYPDLVKRNPAALVERLRPKLSEELASTEEASDENSMSLSESEVPTPEEAGRLIAGATPGSSERA